MTRRQIAAFYGVPLNTVIRSLWQGRSVETLLEIRKRRELAAKGFARHRGRTFGKFPTPWGMKNLPWIAQKIGVSWYTMRGRIYCQGMPTELAFNTPRGGKAGVDFIMPPEEFHRLTAETWKKRHSLWLDNRRMRDLENKARANLATLTVSANGKPRLPRAAGAPNAINVGKPRTDISYG